MLVKNRYSRLKAIFFFIFFGLESERKKKNRIRVNLKGKSYFFLFESFFFNYQIQCNFTFRTSLKSYTLIQQKKKREERINELNVVVGDRFRVEKLVQTDPRLYGHPIQVLSCRLLTAAAGVFIHVEAAAFDLRQKNGGVLFFSFIGGGQKKTIREYLYKKLFQRKRIQLKYLSVLKASLFSILSIKTKTEKKKNKKTFLFAFFLHLLLPPRNRGYLFKFNSQKNILIKASLKRKKKVSFVFIAQVLVGKYRYTRHLEYFFLSDQKKKQ